MKNLHPTAKQIIGQASTRRRWLLFLRRTAKLATVTTLLVLLLGIGMWTGWITSVAGLLPVSRSCC